MRFFPRRRLFLVCFFVSFFPIKSGERRNGEQTVGRASPNYREVFAKRGWDPLLPNTQAFNALLSIKAASVGEIGPFACATESSCDTASRFAL